MIRRSPIVLPRVAFTPKGGCPLKPNTFLKPRSSASAEISSIHPQGWVPIETWWYGNNCIAKLAICSIHPQGWVPIETSRRLGIAFKSPIVAFTPKGGCPLKLTLSGSRSFGAISSSIHPQGWVPIETCAGCRCSLSSAVSSIHPQGWVPIETCLVCLYQLAQTKM